MAGQAWNVSYTKNFRGFSLNALIVKTCHFEQSFQDTHAKYGRRYLVFD